MTTLVEDFREGLAEGRLLVQACSACGGLNLYPRARCPHCHSRDVGWQESSGRGRLHSRTVVRAVAPAGFEDQLPYALGVVVLEDGVQLLGRLIEIEGDWEAYECDGLVQFDPDFTKASPAPEVPWFRPAGGRA